LELTFTADPKTTKLFEPLGDHAETFATYGMTANHHTWGISPSKFTEDKGLGDTFRITAVSYDEDGEAFVAAMEAYDYPFFGV